MKSQAIAIIGAGFTGTALAAACHRRNPNVNIVLIDKKGVFGLGLAYSTPHYFHLLNVRVKDMSAFEDDPLHFARWIEKHHAEQFEFDTHLPLIERFAPRAIYGLYLKSLLQEMHSQLKFYANEVIDIQVRAKKALLKLNDNQIIEADKIIFALGNDKPQAFPFAVDESVRTVTDPWDYHAPKQIPKEDPVLIVGTGLSMIDTVLTLHHQHHQGAIYALSRHGLTPLPHTDENAHAKEVQQNLPTTLKELAKHIRWHAKLVMEKEGDWRGVMHSLRPHLQQLWQQFTPTERKRFLRHALAYWNIHRHRVHEKLNELLENLQQKGQLQILAGRIQHIKHNEATVKIRHHHTTTKFPVKWLINCMGPSLSMNKANQPLIHLLVERECLSLDALKLGLAINKHHACLDASAKASTIFYALGPTTKGILWESTAVPEIRQQCFNLAKELVT